MVEQDQVALFIGPKGSDSNDGLTIATALASAKRAIDLTITLYRDLAVTLCVVPGAYSESALSPLAKGQVGVRVARADI
jgi:hypothetical protein